MYTLELHQVKAAELLRRAERERLAGEARRARRAARRTARDAVHKETEGPVSTDRDRFVHAA
ncbi:hypothetical protein ACFC0C_09865 [Streptomyces sp. NPDC056178]|uniref:hypothetical protein n=1 Tax=unclassified Streptomyces TaxID=2593676 RepID=UPI0035D77E12